MPECLLVILILIVAGKLQLLRVLLFAAWSTSSRASGVADVTMALISAVRSGKASILSRKASLMSGVVPSFAGTWLVGKSRRLATEPSDAINWLSNDRS